MFDFVCIFTTGGVILWCKAFCDLKLDILNIFIKNILLEEKSARQSYTYHDQMIKWKTQNDIKLVFAIVYKEIL